MSLSFALYNVVLQAQRKKRVNAQREIYTRFRLNLDATIRTKTLSIIFTLFRCPIWCSSFGPIVLLCKCVCMYVCMYVCMDECVVCEGEKFAYKICV